MARRTVATVDSTGGDEHLEWVAIASPMFARDPNGDVFHVEPTASGVRLAVLDGRGHGEEAARAAAVVVASLRAQPDVAIEVLLRRAHQDASESRGAALVLVGYEVAARRLSWVALSNVAGSLAEPEGRRQVPKVSGFVGFRFPEALPVEAREVAPGATLILATDGLDPAVVEAVIDPARELSAQAHGLFHRLRKGSDDALLAVVRFH